MGRVGPQLQQGGLEGNNQVERDVVGAARALEEMPVDSGLHLLHLLAHELVPVACRQGRGAFAQDKLGAHGFRHQLVLGEGVKIVPSEVVVHGLQELVVSLVHLLFAPHLGPLKAGLEFGHGLPRRNLEELLVQVGGVRAVEGRALGALPCGQGFRLLLRWHTLRQAGRDALLDILLEGTADLVDGLHLDEAISTRHVREGGTEVPSQIGQGPHDTSHGVGHHLHVGRLEDAVGQRPRHLAQQLEFPHGRAPFVVLQIPGLVLPVHAEHQAAGLCKPRLLLQALKLLGEVRPHLVSAVHRQRGEPRCHRDHMIL
mmetsp:Transcript_3204/g.7561  ORF Transcript_3204/g.7561 Transcript_3204/m.7561 type:complete len:314 (+) Transcript_3204:306-1247(+)